MAAHASELLDTLHHHHVGEDVLLWPKLADRAPLDRALVERTEQQHSRVGTLIAEAARLIPAWTATADPSSDDAWPACCRRWPHS